MKKIAIISDIKINNEQNFKYYNEITIDVYDSQTSSIKHVIPNFDKDGDYKIGELICYDTASNNVSMAFDQVHDVEILTLYIMRLEYNQLLIKYLKEENDYIKDAKKDGNYMQINKYKNLDTYLKQNQERMNKVRTIIKTLNTFLKVVDKFLDVNNNVTKKK